MSKKSVSRRLRDELEKMRDAKQVTQDIVNTYAQVGEHHFLIRNNEAAVVDLYKKIDALHKELKDVQQVEKALADEKAKLKVAPTDGSPS